MSTVAHEIIPSWLSAQDKQKLKTVCQDWTRLSDELYVVHHSEDLQDVCPICTNEFRKRV